MKKAFIVLLIIFLINIPSLYFGWYIRFGWFDVVLHFLGGFFVGMLMYYYLKDYLKERVFLKNTIIIVGATVFIGVMWEFAEYIANQTLIEPFYRWFGINTYFMGDLDDTITDLLMDISGALLFTVTNLLQSRKSVKLNSLQSLNAKQIKPSL